MRAVEVKYVARSGGFLYARETIEDVQISFTVDKKVISGLIFPCLQDWNEFLLNLLINWGPVFDLNLRELFIQLLAHFLFLKEPSCCLSSSLSQSTWVFAWLFQMLFLGDQVHMLFDKRKSVLTTADEIFETLDFILVSS
jgi:hypothetical protein